MLLYLIVLLLPGKSCGNLEHPKNGMVNLSGTLFEDKASYQCNGGYHIVGTDKRVCNSNGEWTDAAPVCAGKPRLSDVFR